MNSEIVMKEVKEGLVEAMKKLPIIVDNNCTSDKTILTTNSEIVMKEVNGQHFYEHKGEVYPSVTTILSAYPKGAFFYKWMKDKGNTADTIRDKAARRGTHVHNAIEHLLNGETLHQLNFTEEEWKMLNRFMDFVLSCKSFKMISTEFKVINTEVGYAGTVDLYCELNGEKWLIDFKTSKMEYPTHHIQTAAYAKATNLKIDKMGILILGMGTRKGWKLAETKDPELEFKKFLATKTLWEFVNPKDKWVEKKVYPCILEMENNSKEVKDNDKNNNRT